MPHPERIFSSGMSQYQIEVLDPVELIGCGEKSEAVVIPVFLFQQGESVVQEMPVRNNELDVFILDCIYISHDDVEKAE